jgi:protoporphyrinogen oxidase
MACKLAADIQGSWTSGVPGPATNWIAHARYRVPEGKVLILGGGVTGLASGLASGLPVYEMTEQPGGICASYYIAAGSAERLRSAPPDGEAYRFEIGGGHWIWGGDPLILRFAQSMTPFKSYTRRAAVFLDEHDLFVPYPIQNHLSCLGSRTASEALCEMLQAKSAPRKAATMADWLKANFGSTLCRIFFDPFHRLYTAGLWDCVAPQDESKSPVDLTLAIQGALSRGSQRAGYNINFFYPVEGLNALAQRMAQRCQIQYGRRLTRVCIKERTVQFEDGHVVPYKALLSTLPLRSMLQMANIAVSSKADPFTSVLVVNIGARKGPRCPNLHWLYVPHSNSGFHRVGFYSNVDSSFLPCSARERGDRVAIYVEKAYPGGQQPDQKEMKRVGEAIVQELQARGWIEEVDVADPTWIETAYTWIWPKSQWRAEALQALEAHCIYQVGRYGRWAPQVTDQGIAQSIRDGLWAGASLREGV